MESSLIDVNSFLEFERKNHPELKIGDKVRIGIKIIESFLLSSIGKHWQAVKQSLTF